MEVMLAMLGDIDLGMDVVRTRSTKRVNVKSQLENSFTSLPVVSSDIVSRPSRLPQSHHPPLPPFMN